MSDSADFVVRLPKEATLSMTPVTVSVLGERSEKSLIELLSDPRHFLSRLDDEGQDLLLHSIAKKLDPVHHWRVIDYIFELPSFYRTLQDSDKNSVLHYLAQSGIDVLRHGTIEDFVYRNKYGNTPLHWMAKNPDFHSRLAVLPFRILSVKNAMGSSVLDIIEKVRAEADAVSTHKQAIAQTEVIASLPLNYKLELSDRALSEFTIGFEFEFVSPISHEHFAEVLHLAGLNVGVVSDAYGIHHGSGYTTWHVTSDPTIEPDGSDDYQIELISPVLRFSDVRPTLNLIWRILADIKAYTNDSCGLHINIGHLGGGLNSKDFNPIKLALFLGDDKIIRTMGRDSNLNCQAFLAYVRGVLHADLRTGIKHIIGPYESPAIPELMRDSKTGKTRVPTGYDAISVVDKIAHDPALRLRLSNSFDKDISLNLTKLQGNDVGEAPIIEYRATGNEWSHKSPRIYEGIARRLAASAHVAMHPELAIDTYKALIVRDIIHGKTPTEHEFLTEEDKAEFYKNMA